MFFILFLLISSVFSKDLFYLSYFNVNDQIKEIIKEVLEIYL